MSDKSSPGRLGHAISYYYGPSLLPVTRTADSESESVSHWTARRRVTVARSDSESGGVSAPGVTVTVTLAVTVTPLTGQNSPCLDK